MEEHKRKIRSDIMKRVKILYGVFVIVALCVLVRIGYVQFGSRETRINAERLHRRLVFVDSLKAHRGSILARDGRPLATSIFRKSIYFDFGSEGFDKREAFLENADSLSKLLARYFGDKSAREYYNKMVSERDRCFKVKYMGTCSVLMSQGKLARWFDRMRGKEYMVVKRYDTTRRHSYTKLFRDVDFNEWQTLREYPILDESTLGRVYLTEVFDHRVYPHDELALRTIGRTDKKRPYGIEEAYKKELQGRNGYQWLQCIAPGFYSRVEGADFREPEDGCDVVTTLDADVQDVADKALRTQISKQNAIWGTSIVMECATGDILASKRCDCGEQLHKAMQMIEAAGKGVLVYLNQEGRGIGLMEKMKAYKLQEDGMDTVDANICLGHLADERDYGVGAQILRELGVHKMRLLTNNPVKRVGLEAYGLEIAENVPIETTPNPYNERYLRTKQERMGHTLHFNK